MGNEVGIVGSECFSPLGTSFCDTWDALQENRSGIRYIDRYNPAEQTLSGVAPVIYGGQIPLGYDEMAGSAERFKRSPEPAYHCVSQVCEKLLKGLEFDVAKHNPQRIAVLGATALTAQISQHTLETTRRPYVNFILNQCHNVPLAIVARDFGLQGPSFTVGGACASGNHAVLVANAMIRSGMLDCAVVVGFEFPLLPINAGGFNWLRALYKPGQQDDRGYGRPEAASRPFSVDRRGLLLAEAVGAVLLSDVDYAQRIGWPVAAKIRGGYMNSDGDHLTRMAPDNVVACMRGALEAARCSPDDIECVNAHATSTPVGDASELEGLSQIFGARLAELPVVANKSQLGHSLGASSILELMAAVEGMTRGILLPTLNHVPDPELPRAFFPTEAIAYPHRLTLLNSFGFGGTNASLVVEAGNQRQQ